MPLTASVVKEMKYCTSCGRATTDYVSFKCPVCGKEIVRCNHCREIINPYKCECGFEGP